MRNLTCIFAYYDNPSMLEHQYSVWATYPEWYQSRVQFVVVDDASPRSPAIDVPRPAVLNGRVRIYRVAKDVPWHQDGARNLGAHVAEDGWLFLTDMDHVLPAASLDLLWVRAKRESCFYTFGRWDADTNAPMLNADGRPKPHPNSYAMARSLYWRAGGYDEDFCGVYGTDGAFRKQLLAAGRHVHLEDVQIIRYSRDVISDASTRTLDRKQYGGDQAKAAAWARKRGAGRENKILTLAFEWERQL